MIIVTESIQEAAWKLADYNREYPGQTAGGVTALADHAFSSLEFDVRGRINMLNLLRRCFQIAGEV